jgi:hypothetical protein
MLVRGALKSPGSAQSIGCSVASARKFSIVKRLCRVISASISSGVTPVNLPTAADRVRRDALLTVGKPSRLVPVRPAA